MVSQKNIYKSSTKEFVCHSGYVVGSNFRKMYLKWYEEKFNFTNGKIREFSVFIFSLQ